MILWTFISVNLYYNTSYIIYISDLNCAKVWWYLVIKKTTPTNKYWFTHWRRQFLYIVVINSDLSYLYIIRPQTFLVNQAKSVVLTFYWPKMTVDQKKVIITLCKKHPVQQSYYLKPETLFIFMKQNRLNK